jgi:hypothetical protein
MTVFRLPSGILRTERRGKMRYAGLETGAMVGTSLRPEAGLETRARCTLYRGFAPIARFCACALKKPAYYSGLFYWIVLTFCELLRMHPNLAPVSAF